MCWQFGEPRRRIDRRTCALWQMCASIVGLFFGSAAFAASTFSGYVTDANGVEPIAGAVVSVEWTLVPAGKAIPGRATATRLAVWQVRTDREGRFRFPDRASPLVLPPGTALAPGESPQLQVFALGHQSFRSPRQDFAVSIAGDRRVTIMTWPSPDQLIRLARRKETSEDPVHQIDGWYAEVQRAVAYEVWAGGEAQARASYGPLLELISEVCTMLEYQADLRSAGCAQAKAEFNLSAPTPRWVEVRPTAREKKSEPPPSVPIVVGTPAPESGTIGGRKQDPPNP